MNTTSELVRLKLKLKLVIDKRKNRVLFAEAGKDFVDFVFHIMSLPLGTVTRIISEAGGNETARLGCLDRLYQGIKDLDECYIGPNNKECLLNCKAPFRGKACHGLLPGASLPDVRAIRLCRCRSDFTVCCNDKTLSLHDGDEVGYVRWKLVFMVMDDLVVKPMSAVSALALMGTGDQFGGFENREVDFGINEAMKLLKASLQSKTVLTDVFLNGGVAEAGAKAKTYMYVRKIIGTKWWVLFFLFLILGSLGELLEKKRFM